MRRNDDSSSDEEDGGRTSAIKERKKKKCLRPPPPPPDIASMIANAKHEVESASSRQKKKKKGKKERIKDSSSSNTIVNALTNINDAVNNNTKTNQVDDIDNNKNDATIIDAVDSSGINNNNNNSTTKKRYKKKIRSRQKNIRKDHRSVSDRPPHLLIPGGGGRPLTHATKQKLGLLHPTTTTIPPTANHDFAVPDSKSFVIDDNAFDSGEWIGNGDDDTTNRRGGGADDSIHGKGGESMSKVEFKQQKTSVRKATTTLTKVGDCIVDSSNNLTDNKAMVIKPMIGGKKGNSQKRKFKNIP